MPCFLLLSGITPSPIEKQWDKILASAPRQILAQVSAFPALMGIKKQRET